MKTVFKTVCIQSITCRKCGKTFEFPIFKEDLERFEKGEGIQYVMPYVSREYRELLISAICRECWDKLFGYDDDDDFK